MSLRRTLCVFGANCEYQANVKCNHRINQNCYSSFFTQSVIVFMIVAFAYLLNKYSYIVHNLWSYHCFACIDWYGEILSFDTVTIGFFLCFIFLYSFVCDCDARWCVLLVYVTNVFFVWWHIINIDFIINVESMIISRLSKYYLMVWYVMGLEVFNVSNSNFWFILCCMGMCVGHAFFVFSFRFEARVWASNCFVCMTNYKHCVK